MRARLIRHPVYLRIQRSMRNRGLGGASFGRNVLVMFFGTVIGQFGTVLLAPALTRLYSPEDFGILGSFTAVVTVASVIAALRYEMAVPLAKNPKEAANLLAVCWVALALTTLIGSILLVLLSPWGWNITDYGALRAHWFLLPLGFLCIGAYQVLVYYATQQQAFQAIARTKIYQGYTGPGLQALLGALHFGPWGLILGFVVGQSTGSGLLISRLVLQPNIRQHVSLRVMRGLARRYVRFPLLSSWSGLINSAGTSALLLIALPSLYSAAVAGFIFLIDRIVGRPMLMVSSSILQVYVGEVSRSRADDPAAMRIRFLRTAKIQLLIVSAWLLAVNLVAPYIFPLAFGEEWRAAVPYLQVMSLALLPQMVMHALIHTLQLLERQGLSAAWETGRLAAVAGALWGGHALGLDALHALLFYSAAQAAAQMVLFFLMLHSIQSYKHQATDEKDISHA